jgi:hypothetical protein
MEQINFDRKLDLASAFPKHIYEVFENVGIVTSVADGIVTITGLSKVSYVVRLVF